MSSLGLHIQQVVVADYTLVFKVKTPLTLQSLVPVLTARNTDTGLTLLQQGIGGRFRRGVRQTPTFFRRAAFSFDFVSFRIDQELLLILFQLFNSQIGKFLPGVKDSLTKLRIVKFLLFIVFRISEETFDHFFRQLFTSGSQVRRQLVMKEKSISFNIELLEKSQQGCLCRYRLYLSDLTELRECQTLGGVRPVSQDGSLGRVEA